MIKQVLVAKLAATLTIFKSSFPLVRITNIAAITTYKLLIKTSERAKLSIISSVITFHEKNV